MKKIVPFSVILSLFITACQKPETTETVSEETAKTEAAAPTFTVDSLAVIDSVKISKKITASSASKILVFPTLTNKVLLDSIYSTEKIQLEKYDKESLKKALQNKQKEFFESNRENIKGFPLDLEQTWSENSDMKLFSRQNDFLTIKYSGDGFTGGAHGYYYEFYKVFDLKNNQTLQLSQVLKTPDSDIWKRALMDNFLKDDIDKGRADMLLVKEIMPNNNFYFDQEYLYFLYNQYEIAAYAAGPILIKLPLKDIKLMLQPDFVKRAEIK